MDNNEITEEKLKKASWTKVGNTFYNRGRAITHFDGKFQCWSQGEYHEVKTFAEVTFYSEQNTKKA